MDSIFPIFAIVLIGAFAVYSSYAQQARAWEMLNDWARGRGLTITDAEKRSFFTGPYFWNSRKSDVIYHFSARDTHSGNLRHGYARCRASWFSGNSVDVTWD